MNSPSTPTLVNINPARTALLVIDMQRDFCAPGGYAEKAGLNVSLLREPIPAISSLLNTARGCGMLVVYTREGHRRDLSDCAPTKMARSRAIHRLILTGVTTEICIQSTLREAVDRGFECITVVDGCASAYPELHAASLAMIQVEGGILGRVQTTAELLYSLEYPPASEACQ
ncbi:MAG: cysteine hydrolase family protein [Sulfuriferula sp.]